MSKVDLGHVAHKDRTDAIVIILKGMRFLDFFSPVSILIATTDSKGQARLFLQAFGDHLAKKMELKASDRDLVFMRHVFTMEKDGKRW